MTGNDCATVAWQTFLAVQGTLLAARCVAQLPGLQRVPQLCGVHSCEATAVRGVQEKEASLLRSLEAANLAALTATRQSLPHPLALRSLLNGVMSGASAAVEGVRSRASRTAGDAQVGAELASVPMRLSRSSGPHPVWIVREPHDRRLQVTAQRTIARATAHCADQHSGSVLVYVGTRCTAPGSSRDRALAGCRATAAGAGI